MKRILLSGLALVILTGSLSGAKVQLWHHHRPSDYSKATLSKVVISNQGTLKLSKQLSQLVTDQKLDATYIWDMKEDRHGNLYLATGKEGRIYRITPTGKVSVIYDSEDSQVFCLALASDGSLYAGTGPKGNVVRIPATGQHRVIYRSLTGYVWSLAVTADGKKIYAGTGPNGTIYEITPEGKHREFYKSRQDHILCLAVGADGQVYAGTDKQGLVYRISPQGKAFVLYQAPQKEVRTLIVKGDQLYVGTSDPTEKKFETTRGSIPGALSRTAAKLNGPVAVRAKKVELKDDKKPMANKSESSSDKKESSSSKPAAARSSPSSGENSLYRISTDGSVREVLREEALILSLLPQKGRFLVGTGMKGQLIEVEEKTREHSEISRLDHGQILCLLQRKDGSILLGTGDPGKVYVLKQGFAASGTVISEVMDAKLISQWGSIRWQASSPKGTKVTVAIRTGNVEEPDETWSEWSVEESNADQAKITSPTARFLQYRVTLSTTDPTLTPSVSSVTLRYQTRNQPPEVTGIEVPNLNAEDLSDPRKLKLKWSATDANKDELTYRIYAKKEGWANWVELAEDVKKTSWTWDTTTTPSGRYRIKVVASDREDNPASEALIGQHISRLFVVNHAPPKVEVKVVGIQGGRVKLEAKASSELSRLISASFTINGKKWVNIFPRDKLFDSRTEAFSFQTPSLKPGAYVVVLKIKDATGCTGSGDVVLMVKSAITK